MRFYLKFFLILFLLTFPSVVFSDFLASENNVRALKKHDFYNDVIKVVGSPKEKIVKKTKNGATWVYNNFELYFEKGKLVKAVKLFDRVVFDESLIDEVEREKRAKINSKKKEASDDNLIKGLFGSGE